MTSALSKLPRWTWFDPQTTAAEALVLQVLDPDTIGAAKTLARRWASIVPRSAFAGVEMDHRRRRIAFAPIQDVVHREIGRLQISMPQIVLVGFGAAAQHALDLALCNILADVHAVLIDLPSASVVVGHPPARGAFRFVQHRLPGDPDGGHFDHAIQGLRTAGLDVRTMAMPDGTAATERAIDTFLVELVARASRTRVAGRRPPSAPNLPEHRA